MRRRTVALESLVVLVAGALLGFLGPFSTYELAPAARYFYWIGLTCVAYALIRPLLVVGRRLARWASLPDWAGELPISSFAALVLSGLIAFLLSDMQIVAALRRPDLPLIFLQVWAVGLLIYLGIRQSLRTEPSNQLRETSAEIEEEEPCEPLPVECSLLKGLPIRSLDELICLRMEDHYVRAYYDGGSHLMLMRLRDAVGQLGAVDGALVNRSWWVPKWAIKRVFGTRRSRRIELVNGLIIPVARSRAAHVDSLGWA